MDTLENMKKCRYTEDLEVEEGEGGEMKDDILRVIGAYACIRVDCICSMVLKRVNLKRFPSGLFRCRSHVGGF